MNWASASGSSAAAPQTRERSVMPVAAFHEVRLGPYFYVGATLGLGLMMQTTGLSEGLGTLLHGVLPLAPGADFSNFVVLSVLATVVSHQPGASHFVIDAGALSLSKDLGPTHLGLEPVFGEVKGHPELTVASVSQEHGLIRAAAPAAIEGKFKVGQQLEIMPNHSCLTEAHFDEYVVIDGGRVMDRWHIERGR